MPETVSGVTPTTGSTAVTGAGATPTASSTAKPGGDLDKDAFLKLLVAQLKYQNPLSPTNPDQFLAQSAQFTMVEKLEEISRAQTDLTVWQKVTAGQSLVGRQVTGRTELGVEVTSVVTGLTLASDGPRLTLADGSRLPVTAVTAVGVAAAGTGSTTTGSTTTGSSTAGSTTTGSTTAGSTTTGSTTAGSTTAGTGTTGPAGAVSPAG